MRYTGAEFGQGGGSQTLTHWRNSDWKGLIWEHEQVLSGKRQNKHLLCSFPDSSANKGYACNVRDTRDTGSFPCLGRAPGGGNGNSLQYSCLKNPMDREAWQATVQRISKSWTRLMDYACSVSQAPWKLLVFSLLILMAVLREN